MCRSLWGKLLATRYKKKKETQLPLLKSQEPKQGVGSKSRVLCMSPAHSTTKGVGGPTSGHAPTLIPYKQPAHPTSGREQGKLLHVLSALCCSGGPNKALPEFLVWPLINFY